MQVNKLVYKLSHCNITTNTSVKNGKQVNQNITTKTTRINVNKIHKQQ